MSIARCMVLIVIAACGGASRSNEPRGTPSPHAVRFVERLQTAVGSRDARAASELFAPDASATLIGHGAPLRGRDAIARALVEVGAVYRDTSLRRGRIWIGEPTSVIEFVVAGKRLAAPILGVAAPEASFGVAAAIVCTFDREGRVRELRLYLDLVTLVGQLDPALLPDGMTVRAIATAPPVDDAIITHAGTFDELRRIAAANQVWTALAARDVTAVMASAVPYYTLDDIAAPQVLDRDGTTAMVGNFLAAISAFEVAATPLRLAAGDDVVTEVVEHVTFRGKRVVLHALDIKRFAGFRVVGEWQYTNALEAVRDLLAIAFPRART